MTVAFEQAMHALLKTALFSVGQFLFVSLEIYKCSIFLWFHGLIIYFQFFMTIAFEQAMHPLLKTALLQTPFECLFTFFRW